jgi:SAM-dependent methyltransferase
VTWFAPDPSILTPRDRDAIATERTTGATPPEYDLSYRDAFWAHREYEDRVDRLALRALLPPGGDHLVDLGAGFGRLIDEYGGYDRVTLVDASSAMLAAAAERAADDPRIALIRADVNRLPFADGSFDTIVAVRLLVHLADPRPLFDEVRRVLRPGGAFVVEFPNRRHVLAMIRRLTRRQSWSPFDAEPYEYLDWHFAHQPRSVRRQLARSGLHVDQVRAVSFLRSGLLKRFVGSEVLARIEAPLQAPLGPLELSPSVYLRARSENSATIASGGQSR